MVFLIDGYNLLFAAGLAGPSLKAARRRLLDWLADAVRGRGDLVRVVFDAQNAPVDSAEQEHRGVRVRFAFRQTADDLIEAMLAAEGRPAETVVVSNDARLHESARRCGAAAWSCQRFMDWLAGPERPAASPTRSADEKPAGPTPDEAAELARAFELVQKTTRTAGFARGKDST